MSTGMVFEGYQLLRLLESDALGKTYGASRAEGVGDEAIVRLRVLDVPGFGDQPLTPVPRADDLPELLAPLASGNAGGTPYSVYPYFRGYSLASFLQRAREQDLELPFDLVLMVAIKLVYALLKASEARSVGRAAAHSFLAPHFVHLTADGELRLSGFEAAEGLHRAWAAGGVPQELSCYLSPEVMNGAAPSLRDDIYSAAAIAFELFTSSRLPEEDAERREALAAARSRAEDRPLPAALRSLLGEALAPSSSRLGDLREFLDRLRGQVLELPHKPSVSALAFLIRDVFDGDEQADSAPTVSRQLEADQLFDAAAEAPVAAAETEAAAEELSPAAGPLEMSPLTVPLPIARREPAEDASATEPEPAAATAAETAEADDPAPERPAPEEPVSEQPAREPGIARPDPEPREPEAGAPPAAAVAPVPVEMPEAEDGGFAAVPEATGRRGGRGIGRVLLPLAGLVVLGVVGWMVLGRGGGLPDGPARAPREPTAPVAVEPEPPARANLPAPGGAPVDEPGPAVPEAMPRDASRAAEEGDTREDGAEEPGSPEGVTGQSGARDGNTGESEGLSREALPERADEPLSDPLAATDPPPSSALPSPGSPEPVAESSRGSAPVRPLPAPDAGTPADAPVAAASPPPEAAAPSPAPGPPVAGDPDSAPAGPVAAPAAEAGGSATSQTGEEPSSGGSETGSNSPPQLLQIVTPDYPQRARRARVRGSVQVIALVGVDGRVSQVRLLRGLNPDYGINAAVVEAYRGATFEPAKDEQGRPIEAWYRGTISVDPDG